MSKKDKLSRLSLDVYRKKIGASSVDLLRRKQPNEDGERPLFLSFDTGQTLGCNSKKYPFEKIAQLVVLIVNNNLDDAFAIRSDVGDVERLDTMVFEKV